MDFSENQQRQAFRRELREWLKANRVDSPPRNDLDQWHRAFVEWHKKLYSGGWMGISWPTEVGGRGLPDDFEAVFNEELGASETMPAPAIGYLGRPMLTHGSPDQQSRFLPRLLSGEEQWCQGFSEPDAGSDLAGLRTRADLRGDTYVVNGQKVWTSFAQYADWCLLLARSDRDAPKHKGISAFVVEMKSPGISVRPLVQITGDTEFSEVFFDDVEIPASQMIGDPGAGWAIAMTTVEFERGPADIGFTSRLANTLSRFEARVRSDEVELDQVGRRRLAEAFVSLEALRVRVQLSLLARASSGAGATPGPAGSVDKLLLTRAEQELCRTVLDLSEAGAVLEPDDQMFEYLYSRAQSIYGGTSQIQRSIIAQRILGLPRS